MHLIKTYKHFDDDHHAKCLYIGPASPRKWVCILKFVHGSAMLKTFLKNSSDEPMAKHYLVDWNTYVPMLQFVAFNYKFTVTSKNLMHTASLRRHALTHGLG
jgi:hypothetical protein